MGTVETCEKHHLPLYKITGADLKQIWQMTTGGAGSINSSSLPGSVLKNPSSASDNKLYSICPTCDAYGLGIEWKDVDELRVLHSKQSDQKISIHDDEVELAWNK